MIGAQLGAGGAGGSRFGGPNSGAWAAGGAGLTAALAPHSEAVAPCLDPSEGVPPKGRSWSLWSAQARLWDVAQVRAHPGQKGCDCHRSRTGFPSSVGDSCWSSLGGWGGRGQCRGSPSSMVSFLQATSWLHGLYPLHGGLRHSLSSAGLP